MNSPNSLENVNTKAAPGETLVCTYAGKQNFQGVSWPGKPIPLIVGKEYIVKGVCGLMISLEGEPLLYNPMQFRRPAQRIKGQQKNGHRINSARFNKLYVLISPTVNRSTHR